MRRVATRRCVFSQYSSFPRKASIFSEALFASEEAEAVPTESNESGTENNLMLIAQFTSTVSRCSKIITYKKNSVLDKRFQYRFCINNYFKYLLNQRTICLSLSILMCGSPLLLKS